MAEIASKWTDAELASDSFLLDKKLNGKTATIAKSAKKPDLIAAYQELFTTKAFRQEGETPADQIKRETAKPAETSDGNSAATEAAQVEEPKYKKVVKKKAEKDLRPTKGDVVAVWYTGKLEDGTVFDTNIKKRGQPLRFKVGTGQVIRGWDEGLLTMGLGEKAVLTIEPEWAYGKKGVPAAGIPPNAKLIFDVELIKID
ncbi:FK506-binding protein 2B [Mycoemilia scoparia]|uniref:peptidylprolyl isomerase n=1 Tax=Mycoemilia scoparia TaxID=417184 RepID=A0A9W8A441_9FUNG|nr:FK506-binding protein 2B [Mycoemilia scoparia]